MFQGGTEAGTEETERGDSVKGGRSPRFRVEYPRERRTEVKIVEQGERKEGPSALFRGFPAS